jgi:regulator of sigma E protease
MQIKPLANQAVAFELERNNHKITKTVTLTEHGLLGVGFETKALPALPFFTAVKQGFNRTNLIVFATLQSFKNMFFKRNIEGLGGPIMIFSETIKHAEQGIKIFLTFLTLISVNLAILNLIPLPILDGGQALFATIEALIRRPLPVRIREYLALGTWVLFILLTLYLSFKDIKFIRALRNNNSAQQSEK